MAESVTNEVGELVPDPKVFQEFDVSAMTGYRWDHSEEMIALGWPLPIRIGDGANKGTPKAGVFAEGAAKAVQLPQADGDLPA